MLKQFQKSDAGFVADVRKTIAFWDRWRRLILPVFIVLLLGLFGLLILLGEFLFDPNNPIVANQSKILLISAFLAGSVFGLHLHGILRYVIDAAIGGYRAERMLLELRERIDERQADNTP